MTNLQVNGQPNQNPKEAYQYLNAVKELIKTPAFRSFGAEQLEQIDAEELIPQHRIFYYYIKGRYYTFLYKETGNLRDLEKADSYFDYMASYAYDENIIIKNPKRLFARCYAKLLLYQIYTKAELKERFFHKTLRLTEIALRHNPNNDSFQWLKSCLEKS